MGSVSQIGWEWFTRLRRRAPTTLVTHVRNRPAIENALGTLPDEILFVDTEWLAGPLHRLARRVFPRSEHAQFLLSSLDFFAYDRAALRLLRRRSNTFDLIHAVTPVTTAAPTRLHRLGKPLILGPLNCGLETPRGFEDVLGDSRWLQSLRRLTRVADVFRGSQRNAACFLTATEATRRAIAPRHRSRCRPMIENGVDLERFHATPWPTPHDGTLRVLFVGRAIPCKGVPFLLEALRALQDAPPIHLTVVGDGPMLPSWEARALELGLTDRVTFTGALPSQRIAAEMARCHVFCLPSFRESGGAVLLEAMACARPVIALAHGGPAEIVDDHVGRALRVEHPKQVVHDLARTLRDVCEHRETWERKGREGRRRAEERYGWDAKVDAALALYEEILRRRIDDHPLEACRAVDRTQERVPLGV
ncbi:MAG: glycosyltransferase [Planctomycetes bacterium]|nr:glycosyltransferase [Planctomycetota bacterium]